MRCSTQSLKEDDLNKELSPRRASLRVQNMEEIANKLISSGDSCSNASNYS